MAPIAEAPGPSISPFSSIKSAFVQATMIGTPAALCVSVPGLSGSKVVLDRVELAGSGSEEGSV